MYVLPDAHGAGVSAALMTEALEARARGAACMWLESIRKTNAPNGSTASTDSRPAAPRRSGWVKASSTTT